MKNIKSFGTYLLIVLAILVIVNVLSDKFFARFDLTQDNRYTLSKATKDILKSIDDPVTIKAYFTKEGLPPQYLKVRRDFKEMIVEFSNYSNGNLVFDFIDPSKDAKLEQEAMQAGIQPVIISVREKDQMKQQKAYMGAVISLGDETEVIPFMKEGGAMEYALATSIKKLSVLDKPKVGLVQGQGEATTADLDQAMQSLNVLYDVNELNLDGSTNLSEYAALAIVAPKDSFTYQQLSQLDNYLSNGGKLYIGINRVDGDLTNAQGTEVTTGLETWLSQKGLTVENNFVIDTKCANVTVRQKQGFFMMNRQVPFYYIPISNTFEDHPITKGLEMVLFPFVSSITYTGDTSLVYTPIVKSSEKSGTQPCPTYLDVSKKWTNSDFSLSHLTLGAVLSGNIVGNIPSKIVLIADGDFAVNGQGQQAQQQQADNISLFVNSIDWLSDDTGLIELRTKGVTSRPLDDLEDSTKTLLKWLNFILPILLIMIYGFIRFQRKRAIRIRRMEKGVL